MLCEVTYNLMGPNNYLACPYLFFWSLIHTSHLSLPLSLDFRVFISNLTPPLISTRVIAPINKTILKSCFFLLISTKI
jgi:hypothetical protein